VSPEHRSLSSPWTRFWKAFPAAMWLFVLTGAVFFYVVRDADEFGAFAVFLVLMTPFMLIMFFRYRGLLDHVQIEGDMLVLRRRSEELRLPLADVMSVNPGPVNVPMIVKLRLRHAGPFGDEVRFATRMDGEKWTSTRLLVVESLLVAVDAAKLGRKA
jgi:hypothetical protein